MYDWNHDGKIDAMDYDFYETFIVDDYYLYNYDDEDDEDWEQYSGGSGRRGVHDYSSNNPSSRNALERLLGYIFFLVIIALIGCFVNELLAVIILVVIGYFSMFV